MIRVCLPAKREINLIDDNPYDEYEVIEIHEVVIKDKRKIQSTAKQLNKVIRK